MPIDINQLLKLMVQRDISDIHFKADSPPALRLHGDMVLAANLQKLTAEDVKGIAYQLMNEAQRKEFERELELDMGYTLDGVSRFRVNIYAQRRSIGVTLRVVPMKLRSFEELNQAEEQSLPDEPLLDMLQRYDLENSLAEGLLTKADRAGMRSAIELRAPFLDVDVMEFAARLPADERVKGITTKVFLKRYALQYLPKAIVYRKKRGLSVPLTAWLRGPLYDWAQGQLQNPLLENVGIRRPQAFALLEEHRQSKDDYARPLWNLLVLSEWMKWADSRKPGGDPD